MRVLFIEDDSVLRDVMQRSLAMAGHQVHTASSIEDAQYVWANCSFDVVLLDLNLPKQPSLAPNHGVDASNGLALLHAARARGDTTPVMVLTARNRFEDRITGLDAGADDYLGKPFDLAEVEARLAALVRRSRGTQDVLRLGKLQLDRRARLFSVAGKSLDLPEREFDLLWELMSPPGQVVRKHRLRSKLAGVEERPGGNALDVFISRLRKKLLGSGVAIRTLRGIGYLLEAKSI